MTDCCVVAGAVRMEAGLELTGCWRLLYSAATAWLSLAGKTPHRDNNGKETRAPVEPPVQEVNSCCSLNSTRVLVWRR